ncbi:L-fucose isomerase-like protein [Burkholderiales bacterium GJ-E10]|nr:L-fucose isomerase-like protein [Burkholderiales bacterium GJ-E10]
MESQLLCVCDNNRNRLQKNFGHYPQHISNLGRNAKVKISPANGVIAYFKPTIAQNLTQNDASDNLPRRRKYAESFDAVSCDTDSAMIDSNSLS